MAFKPLQIVISAKDNASAVLGRLENKIKAVGVAVGAYFGFKAFTSIVESAAEFEAAMSRVEAATGATGQELEDLKKAASDAGASSAFTAVQSANALENLAKAGLSSKEAIQALNPVLSLATAADVDLATAAEYVTKAVMGMGLSFDDAARVADVLAKGANASNTSVSGLAEALSYTAPIAKSVGVSLEETVAIIGKLADSGIDASRAGTALNNILAQFSDPASKFRRELAAAGITTTDFGEALRQLEAAGPKGEAAIRAVGLEAGPALRSLLNQGTAALDGLTQKLQDAQGSAAEAAAVMQNNLQGSMKGLGSVWESVQNTLATPVLPVLTSGIRELTESLRTAIADGTVGRFGQTLKTAFESGIKGIKDFLATLDVNAIVAKLQAWAGQAQAAFTSIAEYARNAGATVQTAWGVMSAGTNTVLAAIYKVAEVFASVASNIQSGLAIIMDGFAKVTFGNVSASFSAAAAEIRLSAEATGAVSEAFAEKAEAAFDAAARGAETARSGWAALTETAETTAPAIDTVAASAQALADSAKKSAESQDQQAQAAIKNAEAAAKNAAEIQVLRAEYDALVRGGNVQAAAEKFQEITRRLGEIGPAAQKAAASQKDVEEAFARLGIKSTAALKNLADQARRDFELIRDSGTASTSDIQQAFAKAAQAAIEAADGSVPSWVRAQAAAHGYTIEVNAAGEQILVLKKKLQDVGNVNRNITGSMGADWQRLGNQVRQVQQQIERKPEIGTDGEEVRRRVSAAQGGGSFSALAYAQQAKDVHDLDAWWEQWVADYNAKNAKYGGTSTSLNRYWFETQKAQYQQARKELEMRERIEQSAQQKRMAAGQGMASEPAAQRGGSTRTINLQIGGRSLGSVTTDAAGEQALESLLSELERAAFVSGGVR